MNTAAFRAMVSSQMTAGLDMLDRAITICPDASLAAPVGTWPFWLVAYHVLCFVDCYSAASNKSWKPHTTFHPKGRKELEDEFPSRVFTRDELRAYLAYCRSQVEAGLARETTKSLAGPSGFSWLKMHRAEVWLYNVRHLQHHTGQLTAACRREGKAVGWAKGGKK